VRLDSGERIDADAVVLAVAAAEVAHLVPDLCAAEREVLGRCAQVAVLQLVVPAGSGSSRPELPRAMWLPRARGGALAGALEASPGTSAAPGQRVLIARREHVAALAERPDERVAERLLLEARRIDPDAAAAVLADEACVRRFERPAFRPGQLRGAQRLRDEARARPQRRLFLCGDYLVGPHVAGEVASGERAARDALEALESLEALEAPRAPGALTSV
jgi:predicted NAD/FAD-dependent oxidoreductase